jgi:hypothetical protein
MIQLDSIQPNSIQFNSSCNENINLFESKREKKNCVDSIHFNFKNSIQFNSSCNENINLFESKREKKNCVDSIHFNFKNSIQFNSIAFDST